MPAGNMAKLNLSTGAVDTAFQASFGSRVRCMADNGAFIYAGGSFYGAGWQARNNMAKITNDGYLDPVFNPMVNGVVMDVKSDGSSIYIGGAFTSVNGLPRAKLAKLDMDTGNPDLSFDPEPDGNIYDIALDGSALYAGGAFDRIGGRQRYGVALLDKASGYADPGFDAGLDWNATVHALLFKTGGDLFVGGSFTSAGFGQPRSGICKVNAYTGVLDPVFSCTASGGIYIYSFLDIGPDIYIGGSYSSINGHPRSGYAKVDAVTGVLDLNPAINAPSSILAFLFDNPYLYLGGYFSTFGMQQKIGLVRVTPPVCDLDLGFFTDVNISGTGVACIKQSVNRDRLYIGGGFFAVNGYVSPWFAELYLGNPRTPTVSPTYTVTRTQTITKTPTVSATITQTLTSTCTFTMTQSYTNTPYLSPTPTYTVTLTVTETPVVSPTPTFTFTDTVTSTPTFTATSSVTATSTETLTATCTWTFTVTSTETTTPTSKPSFTFTRTATLTSTATLTQTITQTSSVTPTLQLTPTYTATLTTAAVSFEPYPNPSSGNFNILFNDCIGAQKAEICLYTSGFRCVKKGTYSVGPDRKILFGVSNLANGTYLLKASLIKDEKEVYKGVQPVVIIK
jgi:hypothetical protein